ncbi:MAG: acyl-CoA thioesterase [Phyllobacterium sp.]
MAERSFSWAPTIGLSWLWGLGFFYSIHVTLTYGWLGFLAFAIPNAVGLWLFGFVLGRTRETPDVILKRIENRYAGAFLLYQLSAVAITIFGFIVYFWTPMFGQASALGVSLFLLLACAIGHSLPLEKLRQLHIVYLFVGIVAAIFLLVDLQSFSGVNNVAIASFDSRFYGLALPTLVGFLVGPWLDIQHWQRAGAIRREGRSVGKAYGLGAVVFFCLISINAFLAAASGPVGVIRAADGVPINSGSLATAVSQAQTAGFSYVTMAFTIWVVLGMASTIDSFYCATRWFMRAMTSRSVSPLLALIPPGVASSPFWILLGAVAVAAATISANLSIMYLIFPFATLFIGAGACLACETMGAKPSFDPVLCFLIGCAAALIFIMGYVSSSPTFLTLSALIALIGALPSIISLLFPDPKLVEAKPTEIVADTIFDPVPMKSSVAHSTPAHGFDGHWFVMQLTPTYDDTNSVGNVYFANYVRWVGKARELFFNLCMPDFDLDTTRFYILTRSFQHDYRREAKEFDPISVRIKIARHNRKFVTLEHEIHSATQGLLGRGEQSLMFVDSTTFNPLDIPGDVIKGFLPYWPKESRFSSEFKVNIDGPQTV